MGSQAHRLMGCLFHPCGVAPEGGAPAQVDVDSIAVWRGELKTTTAQAERTLSKARECFYPWERFTTEPANTLQLARCKLSTDAFLPTGQENGTGTGRRAQATDAELHALKGRRLAAG